MGLGIDMEDFYFRKKTYEVFLEGKTAVGGLTHESHHGVGNSVETRADLVGPIASLPPPSRILVV